MPLVLANALSLPLFSKDAIKEALADSLTSIRAKEQTSIEWSRQLGLAAAERLWQLIAAVQGEAVVECPWLAHLRPIVARELSNAGVLTHDEIWCEVPIEVARKRFEDRAPTRHWIHSESSGSADADWEFWRRGAKPLDIGTVHLVDTTKPVDIQNLVRHLR